MCMLCIGRDDREGTQCGRHNVNCVHKQIWNCEGNGMLWPVHHAPELCVRMY